MHGNSRASEAPTTLYGKYDEDGGFLKWGVSQEPNKRYTPGELNGGYLRQYRVGSRSEMLDRERKLVERFPGPKNDEPWAGARRPKR